MSLVIFLFHGIFRENKGGPCCLDPQEQMTLEDYRQFIEYFLERRYRFVSPDQIIQGLDPSEKQVFFTFDDGYYNNCEILPTLKEYKIPALFFISPNYILQNKSFWWDVLYRERKKRGTTHEKIYQEGKRLKTMTHDQIEQDLVEQFGQNSLKPCGDLDRPFRPAELKQFSREPFVFLGNHTLDHAILTNYPHEEIRPQIVLAQASLFEITGIRPRSFSYPNGNYSSAVIRVLKEEGFRLGLTCRFGANPLPIDFNDGSSLRLKRMGLSGGKNLIAECEKMLRPFSSIVLWQNFRDTLKHLKQGIS